MARAQSWRTHGRRILPGLPPDLVIAAVKFEEKALAEILGHDSSGSLRKTSPDIHTDTAVVAGTVGKSSRGEKVIQAIEQHIQRARAHVGNRKHPEFSARSGASRLWVRYRG